MNCHDWSTAAFTQELSDFQPPCPLTFFPSFACPKHAVPRRRGRGHPGTLHRQTPQNVFLPPPPGGPGLGKICCCNELGNRLYSWGSNSLSTGTEFSGWASGSHWVPFASPRAVGAGAAPPAPAKWTVRFSPFLEALAGPLARARWTICFPPALDCWTRFGRRPGIWLL